ncbi:sortase-associated OmpA-like protein PdsO [Alteromonas gilva]|uniref:Sortase-associated OmpA-like protein PdsO n=1 Tax=Alteromonas gilva TaxID=2987522 RepID=A0ABT5KYT4_9ALTE|nr:sortase-associated OmpA-like protein PdsO [Alteromonas gilva]MDC8829934.1 sortase-associated OmpA-like protein PdsO [Alteromonas gilva]
MRKTLLSTVFAMSYVAHVAAVSAAEQKTGYEHAPEIGLGSGIVIGAIVAGPAGAAVAGMMGAMLGNDVRQDKALAAREQRLSAQSQLLSERDQSLLAMRSQLQQMQQARLTPASAKEETVTPAITLQSSVQFQTGAHQIAPDYQQQLDLIARALKGYPSLQARLTGYADQRGDAAYNQALSMQRAISVKQYLLNQGVDKKQVLTLAVGEEKSRYKEYEGTFFDRKVVIELGEADATLTARR